MIGRGLCRLRLHRWWPDVYAGGAMLERCSRHTCPGAVRTRTVKR